MNLFELLIIITLSLTTLNLYPMHDFNDASSLTREQLVQFIKRDEVECVKMLIEIGMPITYNDLLIAESNKSFLVKEYLLTYLKEETLKISPYKTK